MSLCFVLATQVSAEENRNTVGAASQGSERRAQISETLQNRMINLVRNVGGKMNSAIGRLENIAERTEERLTILDTQGVQTAAARASLEQAKAKLTEAKIMLQETGSDAESALVSDNPRDSFKVVRPQYTDVRSDIRDSYIYLRETILELKDAVQEAELNKETDQVDTEGGEVDGE